MPFVISGAMYDTEPNTRSGWLMRSSDSDASNEGATRSIGTLAKPKSMSFTVSAGGAVTITFLGFRSR